MSDLREKILEDRKTNGFDKFTTTKTLHVDRIKDLEDVKRVLKFLNITIEADGVIEPHGYDEVRDLFEY